MLYILFVLDTILLGLLILLTLIGEIKLYKYVVNWFDNQQDLGQKELDMAFHNRHLAGAKEEKNRIREILKDEYNQAKQQDNPETIKTIIKINKLIKQEEES